MAHVLQHFLCHCRRCPPRLADEPERGRAQGCFGSVRIVFSPMLHGRILPLARHCAMVADTVDDARLMLTGGL